MNKRLQYDKTLLKTLDEGWRFRERESSLLLAWKNGVAIISQSFVSFNAFLCAGKFEEQETEHFLSEILNSEFEWYMAVAKKSHPELQSLFYQMYENHSLDAGLVRDTGTGWPPDSYAKVWISVAREPGKLEQEELRDIQKRLNLFTEATNTVYIPALLSVEHFGEVYEFATEPKLPKLIEKEFEA